MTAIWWIRRDLRLTDNPALQSVLKTESIIPVFILDPGLLSRRGNRAWMCLDIPRPLWITSSQEKERWTHIS